MAVLRVSDLVKSYGSLRAVDGVSFQIEAGGTYGLLGPNGAGKTTTIGCVARLLIPDTGQVEIEGDSSGGRRDVRQRIGFVPQEISLSEKLTGLENLRFYGQLYGLRGRDLNRQIDRRLAEVGLTERAKDRAGTYSGGMQRRLNIAAALLHDPALLLMDEPTAGVDPQSRAYIFEIVEQLAAAGSAVLYTTHYMEEAERLCRRIGIMDHGQLLAEGTLEQLVERVSAKSVLRIAGPDLNDDRGRGLAAEFDGAPFEIRDDVVELTIGRTDDILPRAVRAADRLGIVMKSIALREPDLEAVFLDLTGRALRD